MIFLIQYDRHHGRVVTLQAFDELARRKVEYERLEMEIDLNRRGRVHEVILFEAATEADLRRTHRRYFEDLTDLVKLPAS